MRHAAPAPARENTALAHAKIDLGVKFIIRKNKIAVFVAAAGDDMPVFVSACACVFVGVSFIYDWNALEIIVPR